MSDSDTLQAMFRLLNEVRSKLDEQGVRLDKQAAESRAEFRALHKKIDDWQETTAAGVGFATHANLRNAAIETEIEALKRRVEALEGSLSPTGH